MNYVVDHQWHKALLSNLAARMKPNCFIELGLGTDPAVERVGEHCNHAYGVDRNIAGLGAYPNTTLFEMTTDMFFAEYVSMIEPPELVFIDADHRSEQVLKDLANVQAICAENCIVVLHDTYPESAGFTSDEYCSDSHKVPGLILCEHVTLPFPPGITICRLRPKPLF